MNINFQDETIKTKSGFVAIIGRPNVGKSTLLNSLIGEKISITADKPQTTRHRIRGVYTEGDNQVVYIDTPGMHLNDQKRINKQMNKTANSALNDVELILFVIEAFNWTREDKAVLAKLQTVTAPVILLINKVDKINDKNKLLPFLAERAQDFKYTEIIPISALRREQVDVLMASVTKYLVAGPFFFPQDQKTDVDLKFRLAEIIREKLTRNLLEELPYALTVAIEHMQVNDVTNQLDVHGVIWVERSSQKSIVIGKQGSNLKLIGTLAREDMNKLVLDRRVHLKLWVKIRAGWSDNDQILQSLGYIDID
jgi:GTP-binding protein Era